MALTIPCTTSRVVSIEEYLDYVQSNVDLRDHDSIAASAPVLRALANDRTLVVRRLNKQVENAFGSGAIASAQAVFLGKGENFFVRANIWPSAADIAAGRVYQDQFSYHIAHDHSYTFMTVGYLGPGYETDIYEYDYEKMEGYVGEPVEMRFLEKVRFSAGMVMLYRMSRDLHIQYPPHDLTVTLNLMVSLPQDKTRDQFYFDLATKTVMGYPPEHPNSERISVIGLASRVGNEDTRQLLTDLARKHPCRRTRLAALDALCKLAPANSAAIWESACGDPAPLVANTARRRLAELSQSA